MKLLSITSTDSLEAAVADIVRLKIKHTQFTAEKDAAVAALEKQHQPKLTSLLETIADAEAQVLDYCIAHRGNLFPEKKSRETTLAIFGFELTPWRVETSSKKITWKEVIKRLQRLLWGKAYIRTADPKPDKEALLTDRKKLNPKQLVAAGLKFEQDEQFFIRPKPATAEPTVKESL
jgi:phage host-nuclease inhibitor protein Gam